jgi:hypothetical protein
MLLCVSSRGCLKRYIAPEIFANLPLLTTVQTQAKTDG